MYQHSITQRIWFRNFRDSWTYLWVTSICEQKFWGSFNNYIAFPEKWFCVRQANVAFKTLHQYSITQKIWFKILRESKTSLWVTPYGKKLLESFKRLQNKFIGNYSIQRNSLESFKKCLVFPKNWFCLHWENLAF